MERAVTDFLGKLGISDTEAQLYVDLLELGPSSIAELTRKSTIPRTTVRENVERLIQKGLVSQTFKGARKKLVAEEPNKAKLLLMDRKLDLENQQRNIEELEGKFEGFVNALYEYIPGVSQHIQVSVKYYEGKREVDSVYTQLLAVDELRSFADLERYYTIYPEKENAWNSKAFEENPKREVWDILVDNSKGREVISGAHQKYHTKFLPKGVSNGREFSFSDLTTWEDKIALIQLDQKNVMATVIESEHIAETFRFLHKTMWEIL